MQILIDDMLTKRSKTRYWLSKEVGITYANLCKLADNKTISIRFDLLEKICMILNCTPNDILKSDLIDETLDDINETIDTM